MEGSGYAGMDKPEYGLGRDDWGIRVGSAIFGGGFLLILLLCGIGWVAEAIQGDREARERAEEQRRDAEFQKIMQRVAATCRSIQANPQSLDQLMEHPDHRWLKDPLSKGRRSGGFFDYSDLSDDTYTDDPSDQLTFIPTQYGYWN